jgi:hypothetical protein
MARNMRRRQRHKAKCDVSCAVNRVDVETILATRFRPKNFMDSSHCPARNCAMDEKASAGRFKDMGIGRYQRRHAG